MLKLIAPKYCQRLKLNILIENMKPNKELKAIDLLKLPKEKKEIGDGDKLQPILVKFINENENNKNYGNE